jgi:adenine/guanine phosphoribosyltransferase-like PRPP-binding protein
MSELVSCDHIRPLYSYKTREVIVKRIVSTLKPKVDEFDCIIVSGYSMSLIGPIIAHKLKKDLCLVRKSSEVRTTSYKVEGFRGQRCIFIDDLICSGETFRRVKYDAITGLNSVIVGIILYNTDYWDGGYRGIPVLDSFTVNDKGRIVIWQG